jgi:hypothetical protein
MKRTIAIIFIVVMVLAVGSLAETKVVKFKDVKDTHWAASSVYDLVKLGVTKGYPDGTYRGNKPITRYETAIFLSKFSQSIGGADLKNELAALRADVKTLKETPSPNPISGKVEANWKFCNLLAVAGSKRGAIADYRLRLSSSHNLGKNAQVKINLDTMDYGYNDSGLTVAGDILATKFLDLEGDLTLDLNALGFADPVGLKVTYGPGPQQHAADPTGVIPSEIGKTYLRPTTGLAANTKVWGIDVTGSYQAISQEVAGLIDTSNLSGQLGYTFQGVPLINSLGLKATGQYVSSGIYSADDRNMRAGISLLAPLGNKIEAYGNLDLGGNERKKWLVAGSLALNDLWDTGTVAVIKGAKVGSEFIDSRFAAAEFYFAGLDTFDRPLENGTVNFGGELVQKVSDDISLVGQGDIRLDPNYKYQSPKGRITAQGGVTYNVAPNTMLDAYYRINHDKGLADTTDVAGLGLQYQF